jgi:hypothetical protein
MQCRHLGFPAHNLSENLRRRPRVVKLVKEVGGNFMRWFQTWILLALAGGCLADTITLKNGQVIRGNYLGGSPREIKVEVGDRVQTYDVSEVSRIEFTSGQSSGGWQPAQSDSDSDRPVLRRNPDNVFHPDGDSVSTSTATQPSDSGRPTLRRPDGSVVQPGTDSTIAQSSDDGRPTLRRADDSGLQPIPNPAPPPDQPPQPVLVPSGTNIVIRMIDPVDSRTNTVGQTFSASVADPVVLNGKTVIPRGADVVVKLVDASESGKLSGKTELSLDLVSVKVNGKVVNINTQSVTQASSDRGKGTAEKAGGGAVLGAVIGAIAGGGKGAAIGAGAGAAAGTAAQVATKGQQVKVPAETRLTFMLQQDVQI